MNCSRLCFVSQSRSQTPTHMVVYLKEPLVSPWKTIKKGVEKERGEIIYTCGDSFARHFLWDFDIYSSLNKLFFSLNFLFFYNYFFLRFSINIFSFTIYFRSWAGTIDLLCVAYYSIWYQSEDFHVCGSTWY